MKTLLSACLLAALLPLTAAAQIQDLPNTGCKNAGPTPVFGAPKLGQTLTISSTQLPCNSPGTTAFVLVNAACTSFPGLPFSCFTANNPCAVLLPVDFVASRPISATLRITIPNNRVFVGGSFCVQGGCLHTFMRTCLAPLNQIAKITVQA